jgi:transposase
VPKRADEPSPKPAVPDAKDQEIARLRRELERLQRENARLKRELDLARRVAKRQAAPFSKGAPTPTPRRAGRRAGRGHGRHAHRPVPAAVDETVAVPLPRACPDCGGRIAPTRVAVQYQEDLPVVRPTVRRFTVHVGACAQCGRRVQGRHALQTSDALGAAAVQLGPPAVAWISILNKHLGLSHAKVATLLRERFGLTVTPSAVTQALHRAARQAQPTYAALRDTIRGSPVVAPDETSWKVGGQLHWLWAFATPETTVYAIHRGRGFAEAASVLGADYAGVLVRDGWAPYRDFRQAAHQTCLAHLLRRCRELRTEHPHAAFPRRMQAVLQRALALRDRRADGTVSPHGAAVARGHLMTQVLALLDHPGPLPAMRRFAAHLTTELPALLSFLFDPTIDATNWRAEHAIRPAVVNRKVCGGNRSTRGADTQQVLASVIRTARQRGCNAGDVLVDLLRAPQPRVSTALQSPAPR